MPQFDQISFFTQVFWFLLLFFIFYFLLTYYFLPKICYNLKFRKKKINFNSIYRQNINFEKNNIIIIFNNINNFFFFSFNLLLNKKLLIYILNKQSFNNFLFNNYIKKNIELILKFNFLPLKKIQL